MVGTPVVLPAELRSVPEARRLVREALEHAGATHLEDRALLVVSELVTNAVAHAGSAVRLAVRAGTTGVRLEVGDDSDHLPRVRSWSTTAATGRGLRLVEHSVDRWAAERTAAGKTVWCEIGTPPTREAGPATDEVRRPTGSVVRVRLLQVPLLMHWAWQEHAQSLLREHLLQALEEDPSVLEQHAQASAALSLLQEQVPQPALPDDPDALLVDVLDPQVTAEELVLEVPEESLPAFATLHTVITRALEAADAGLFLGPPTQPEIREMREWLCGEVLGQAAGDHEPRPWHARTDVRTEVPDAEEVLALHAAATGGHRDVLITDETSVVVAVGAAVAAFLGYAGPDDLVGRRVIAVVPHRYHQAHIAGTTLHATHGRDPLLGVHLTVPFLRADGSEVDLGLCVAPQRLGGRRFFVAELDLPS